MPHTRTDLLLQSNSAALPNAANTVNTSGVDLGATTPFPTTGKFTVQLATTLATGANSKNINVVFQDSADNSTFANIPSLAVKVIAGNTTAVPATTVNVALPPSVRQYIRASATGEANGGNSADGTMTVKVLV